MSSQTRPDTSKGAKHLVESFPDLTLIPDECVLAADALSEPVDESGSVPVIDVGGLDDPTRRARTVEEIALACEESGFFIATNHGFNQGLMDTMLKTVTEFFSLPAEEKSVHSSDDIMSPVLYGSDLHSSVGIHARHWRDYLRHYGRPFDDDALRLWPANPPEYREVCRVYLEEVWGLAMKIVGAISEGLGLDPGYIEGAFGEGSQIVACNYYPECPQPDRTLGLSGHTDRGGVTLLLENGIKGLQVRRKGKWVPVPHVPGSFMVTLGDCIEIMSNGKYRSVEHRAVVNKSKARVTVAVGNGPGYDTIVEPVARLIDAEADGPKHEPVQFRELRFKDYK